MNEQDTRFMEELNKCSETKKLFKRLLIAIQDLDDKTATIDEIDEFLFNNVRTGSKIMVEEWARLKQASAATSYQKSRQGIKHGKKN